MSPQLWLWAQGRPISHWVLNRIQPNPDPAEPTEPPSPHTSDLPPEAHYMLNHPEDPDGFDYLGSSPPSQMFVPPQQLTDNLLPFPNRDSAGQLPPDSDRFPASPQDLPATQVGVIPMADEDHNHSQPLPHPLKSTIQTIGLDPGADHQSLEILLAPIDNQSLTTAQFVSPEHLENDLAQHPHLATLIVETENQFKEPEVQKQPLQDGYLESDRNMVYSDSQTLKTQGNTDEPSAPLEQVISSKFHLETHTQNPETPEEVQSPVTQQDTSVQHELVGEDVVPSVHQEANVPFPSEKEAQLTVLPNALLNLPDVETIPTPRNHQTPGQPPGSLEEEASLSFQQEVPDQTSELPEITEPSEASELEITDQPSESLEEIEPLSGQQEAPALAPGGDEKPSSEQEIPAENIQTVQEVEPIHLVSHSQFSAPPDYSMPVATPSQDRTQYSMLPSTTAQILSLHSTVTEDAKSKHSHFLKKTEAHPPKQAHIALRLPVALQLSMTIQPTAEYELSPTVHTEHSSATSPEKHDVTLPHPDQVRAPNPLVTEVTVEPFDLKLTLTPGSMMEAEPSPTIQNTLTDPPQLISQAPVYYIQVQQPNLTPEPTTEVNVSPSMQATPTHQSVSPTTQPPSSASPSPHIPVTQVTVKQLGLGLNMNKYFSNHVTVKILTVQVEQVVTPKINICELCACPDQTMLCTGLSPMKKLHQVPVPDSHTKKRIFTMLNFQGNSISYLGENVWKTYRWVGKLILSENRLTELHKDSFEGLLSLEYLDLSCNKIQYIERRTFEPLPFLKFLNLRCNLLTELNFGTFQTWHGMQFLHQLILSRNPLTAVEDSYLFKLPALKYLDMGTTQVELTTIENILMLTLELEKLILPHHVASCLCQFQSHIEVVCKTIKLICENSWLINTTHCSEEATIGNPDGTFMKVLKARKKNTSTELTIESEKEYSEKNDINYSSFLNEQLDFNDESDIISALNYILPYFSQGNLDDVELTLLPFIKLLFTNVQGDNAQNNIKSNKKSPFLKPVPNKSVYENKLKKLYFLENLLDAEIQEKINEVKNKEKTAMVMESNLLGPKFKRQLIQKKPQSVQEQDNTWAEMESAEERLQRFNRVLRGPKSMQRRNFKEMRKQSGQPLVKNIATEKRYRSLPLRELEQLHVFQEPRKLVGNALHTQLSFIKKHKAVASSFQKQDSASQASLSTTVKSLHEVRNEDKDLAYSMFVLEDANSRVKSMEALENPVIYSRKNYRFPKTGSPVTHRMAKAKLSGKFRTKTSRFRPMPGNRPPFSAVRRLINSPSGGDFSSLRKLNSPENPFPRFYDLSDPSVDRTSVGNQTATHALKQNVSKEKTTVPKQSVPQTTTQKKHTTTADPNATALNLIPTMKHTNETQWEYPSVGTDSPVKPTDSSSPFLSYADHVEMQLNQQLRPLIPNNDVRKLLSHLIRTLKFDCTETIVQEVCSKLISRIGLLMKFLSKQQEVKVSKAEWDTDQWKTENYINESTEGGQGERKELSQLVQEVPGYGYNNKLILAISVTVVVMILIIIFCLIEIYSHRTSAEGSQESSRTLFGFLGRKCSSDTPSQEGFFSLWQSVWLRDMYRPLNATRKKNMVQKLHDKDSSDEGGIFHKKQKVTKLNTSNRKKQQELPAVQLNYLMGTGVWRHTSSAASKNDSSGYVASDDENTEGGRYRNDTSATHNTSLYSEPDMDLKPLISLQGSELASPAEAVLLSPAQSVLESHSKAVLLSPAVAELETPAGTVLGSPEEEVPGSPSEAHCGSA
ncbi:leucine-rich repeat-containing protein 37A-like [Perognathus longimembris pacificus]|uniref:leucine-rich repeat-containing protein 37A-like n=1 Tax=Perognathus longimembris pacificus TaxID=214514 RepID=UPI002019AC95|nr:leucine-rich repeat-containing protein 37A-like [Perognathus longimembris pacificus]